MVADMAVGALGSLAVVLALLALYLRGTLARVGEWLLEREDIAVWVIILLVIVGAAFVEATQPYNPADSGGDITGPPSQLCNHFGC